MDKIKLQDIVAVANQSGLFKIIGRSRTGIIVESIDEQKKRMSVSLTTKVSVLNEIAMYSKVDDINLGIILLNIKKSSPAIPGKNASPEDLRKFMTVALPDYDEQRVYLSHIQKLANWYNTIHELLDYEDLQNIHFPETKEEVVEKTEIVEENTEVKKEKKPRKTAAKKTEQE
ncbi:MAG: DUF5606 domain-containing protein [Bacteroidetes bacterium]|nr:DUF5606 domain-containing protein [Bacteroidota bacterium]